MNASKVIPLYLAIYRVLKICGCFNLKFWLIFYCEKISVRVEQIEKKQMYYEKNRG